MPLIHYTCHFYTGLCEWIQKKIYLYFLFAAKNISVRFVELYVKYSNDHIYSIVVVYDTSKHLSFLIIHLYKATHYLSLLN